MNTNEARPIWGTAAKVTQDDARDGKRVDSPRAGGRYFVTGTAESVLETCCDRAKIRLTDWLVEQRRLGDDCPNISPTTVKDARRRRNKTVSGRADSILRCLAVQSEKLGSEISYFNMVLTLAHEDPKAVRFLELLAHGGCVDGDELQFLMDYLESRGLVKTGTAPSDRSYVLTVDGHSRLAELDNVQTASSNAFVAMWFDESMNDAYENGVRLGIKDAGYEAVRIDRQEQNNRIDDEIIAEIRRSRFVVADFTQGDSGSRGGVNYEAGFAHGLDFPVIFSCREDCLKKVHFDTRQYKHIVWTDPGELRTAVRNRILATVGENSGASSG